MHAFGTVSGWFRYTVLGGVILFAFTTTLAWAYYGEKCFEYLLGLKFAHGYRWAYIAMVAFGANLELNLVWSFALLMNAFMALPNLYSVFRLSKVAEQETERYIISLKAQPNPA